MLDAGLPVGTKVMFVGPLTPAYQDDYGLSLGDVGVIDVVDDDAYMPYRVKFPSRDWGVWVSANRMALATDDSEEPELCGWKVRALKAESELKELKKALSTLSEG